MANLKEKHEQFCREYIVDLNATQAYLRVYKSSSEKAANKNATRLMVNDGVQKRIQELANERADRTEVNADTVLKGLLEIATTDIAEAFNEDGTLKPIHEIPIEVRKAISSIEVNELFEGFGKERTQIGLTKKIKFWDKVRSLENLGRHLKLFTDKLEVTDMSLADEIRKARLRVEE